MYERPGSGRGRGRKWLPWAGADLAYELLPTSGRDHPGRRGEKAGEIRDLYDSGLRLAEIIAEGQRRLDAKAAGWKANYARNVLRAQRQRDMATA